MGGTPGREPSCGCGRYATQVVALQQSASQLRMKLTRPFVDLRFAVSLKSVFFKPSIADLDQAVSAGLQCPK